MREPQRSRVPILVVGVTTYQGEDEKIVHRAKGHRWSICSRHAVREMRSARLVLHITCRIWATSLTAGARSDTEMVMLRSARGDGKRAIARWYLASCLLNLAIYSEKKLIRGEYMPPPSQCFVCGDQERGVGSSETEPEEQTEHQSPRARWCCAST